MPLSFEANAGQTDAQVQYLSRGSGYALFLTSTGAVLSLAKVAPVGRIANPSYLEPDAAGTPPASVTGVALAMNLVGGNPRASVAGLDQLPGTSNYFIGNDPSQWHTGIANYGRVAYQDVYPGVNLVYYGNEQALEYDFVVAPGADPTRIRLAFQGADKISLDDQGNLVLSTASGDGLEHAPVVYQEVGGARQTVAGQFVLLGQDEVGFQVGPHDASLPLTIDPVLSYSTYLGGSANNYGNRIAVDASGNAYVTGATYSTDFPTSAGAYQTPFRGSVDAFVTKLNATATAVIYSTYLGGNGAEYCNGIALDGSGNAYVTGITQSSNFPTTAGAFQTSFGGGGRDAFVTKLNAAGTALSYSTYLGGSGDDDGFGVAVDASGNAYVTGATYSTDFPTTAGAFQTSFVDSGLVANEDADAFVAKLNAAGTALIYSTYLGDGNSPVESCYIALDGSGDAYVTGLTYSTDFPTTAGAFQTSSGGRADAFVAKLNADGTALSYSTYLGGTADDGADGIAVDGAGNAYVTGGTDSTDFPTTPGAYQTSSGGGGAFVTKLNADGTALIYSTFLGGSAGVGIAVDGSGTAYVTGTAYAGFPTTAGAYQTRFGGVGDAFVTKLNGTGTALIYSTYIGGNKIDMTRGIAVDSSGNAYVTGVTQSTNFPTTAGALRRRLGGGYYDAFVAKFTFAVLPTADAGGPYTINQGAALTLDASKSTDLDGDTLTYSWTINGQAHAASGVKPTLTWAQLQAFGIDQSPNPINVSVLVDDGHGSTSSASTALTVLAPALHFAINVPNSTTAGAPFIITVTAQDGANAPVTGYTGTIHFTSTDAQATLPADIALTGGFGFFLATLKTAGSQTITVTDTGTASITGTANPITVSADSASRLAFTTQPSNASTGSAFNVTVTALDQFGNTATAYGGLVHFTSSDASATLPANSTLSSGVGTFSATLNAAGSQTITATDTLSTNPTITGTSGAITTRGLTVTSFTPTPTGFTATFSKPFIAADLTLYGTGRRTVQDVTLVGNSTGPISGTLLTDPLNTSVTFKATGNTLTFFDGTPVLPDGTYTVTLVSGSGTNGFMDALNAGLDGTNTGGHANYTTTFTTANQTKQILSIPDFARGPDGTHSIKVPNDTDHGIPITLSNAASVTNVTFTLSYNPSLLTVTGGANGDATDPAISFTLVGSPTIIDATHATANFSFHDGTAQSGTVVLGDITAMVPNSAAGIYKTKELLGLGMITVNGAAFTGVWANGVHVNAYFGDVTGNATIDGLDVATAATVAQGTATGFVAYQLLDPAVVGDVANDISVDAGDVSDLASFTVHLPAPVIPAIPTGLTITPVGPDPTLSLGEPSGRVGRISNPSYSGIVSVPVLLDHPDPIGSTGMTEAILALTYDPSVLSVSSADITLGWIPGLGAGWQLTSVVDPKTGQIGIELYSTTPITSTQGGSLVNIAFHVNIGEPEGVSPRSKATALQLVSSVTPNGQQFATQVDDAQGAFVLSPGMDRLVVQTDADPIAVIAPIVTGSRTDCQSVRGKQDGLPIRPTRAVPDRIAVVDKVFTQLADDDFNVFGA